MLTNNSDFNFGSIRSKLIDRRDLVSAAVFAFRLVVKELAVIGYILYSAMCSLLNALVVDYPCNIWRWLADDLNIEVERFVLTHSYVTQISSINLWWNCKREQKN